MMRIVINEVTAIATISIISMAYGNYSEDPLFGWLFDWTTFTVKGSKLPH